MVLIDNALIVENDLLVIVSTGGGSYINHIARVGERAVEEALQGGWHLSVEHVILILRHHVSQKRSVIELLIIQISHVFQQRSVCETADVGRVWIEDTLQVYCCSLVSGNYVFVFSGEENSSLGDRDQVQDEENEIDQGEKEGVP